MGRLIVVGTPIGNRGDLSPRALESFRTAVMILCEDTRVTRKLLTDIETTAPVRSIHHHSTPADLDRALDAVATGDVVYVSDAGTPGISDPGGKLVARAHVRKIPVVVIPGPSALTAALSISGFPTDKFRFLGFLPHKKGRETLYREIAESEDTIAFFESPHRLMKTLEALLRLGLSKPLAVCRELTKIHESVVRGTITDVHQHFNDHPDEVRGEIVIVISPA